jgi:2-polyprenyl-6-methoxyphenol hydroxylase-like FAD-dependent oxidoreductase
MKIVCVGGGLAGLYFALLMKLRDPGHHITVFERNSPGSTQGWGMTFGSDFLKELHRNDPDSAEEIRQAAFQQCGQVVDIHGEQVLRHGGGVYGIIRQRLLDILADRAKSLGVHIEFDHEVMGSSQLPSADLIVACDGVNSRLRLEAKEFETDVRIGTNKYLWLGTDKAFEAFTYAFVHTDSGWVWAYCYGIDAELSTFVVECSPDTWAGLGFDTLSSQDGLSLLEKLFEGHLDGHSLLGQAPRGASAGWLNFRTVTNRRWYNGNIVLAGDAAHTTHFTIGSGTTLAMQDAIALADSLRQHREQGQALESYETRRQAELRMLQSDALFSGQWFESFSRYADLKPHKFSMLLDSRRSPLLPHLSPNLYYRLQQATEKAPVLSDLRRRAGAKAVHSRRWK